MDCLNLRYFLKRSNDSDRRDIKEKEFLLYLKEYKLIYSTKATQENLYYKFLKLIRGLIGSRTKSQLKIHLILIESVINNYAIISNAILTD